MAGMKPFLKWAGNKFQIVERIKAVLPPGKRLIEPFVGSGAVFLNTDYPLYLLADANADLINLYQQLQAGGQEFIDYCRTFFVADNNQAERYYELRHQFNGTRDPVEKAALFVYLNKHCYNGLCRYNAKGGFNVPFGRYMKPYFPEKEMYNFYVKSAQATFVSADFASMMRSATSGDIIYCDPPYVPLSQTAKFTSYSPQKFAIEEQKQLARLAAELANRGVPVVISNHYTDSTSQWYRDAAVVTLEVQRYISRNGSNRVKVAEILAKFEFGEPAPEIE
ncbi:MAG: DNA adenine methylase [Chloroflexi bacterium]|nr:MAG: DNA adenine methylase [Chloroflexota bacterium]